MCRMHRQRSYKNEEKRIINNHKSLLEFYLLIYIEVHVEGRKILVSTITFQ